MSKTLDYLGNGVDNPFRDYMKEKSTSMRIADRGSCGYSDCIVVAEDGRGFVWYFISKRVGYSHILSQLAGMARGGGPNSALTLISILIPWPGDLEKMNGLPVLHS